MWPSFNTHNSYFTLKIFFFIKFSIKYVYHQVCLGKLTFIDSFITSKILFWRFNQERLNPFKWWLTKGATRELSSWTGSSIWLLTLLRILVHRDIKKKFWVLVDFVIVLRLCRQCTCLLLTSTPTLTCYWCQVEDWLKWCYRKTNYDLKQCLKTVVWRPNLAYDYFVNTIFLLPLLNFDVSSAFALQPVLRSWDRDFMALKA